MRYKEPISKQNPEAISSALINTSSAFFANMRNMRMIVCFVASVLVSQFTSAAQMTFYEFQGGLYDSTGEVESAARTVFDTDLVWLYQDDIDTLTFAYATGYGFYNASGLNGFAHRSTGVTASSVSELRSQVIAQSLANCQQFPLFAPAILSFSAGGSPGMGSALLPASLTRTQFANDCGGSHGTQSNDDFVYVGSSFFTVTVVEIEIPDELPEERDPKGCEAKTPNPIDMLNGYKFHSQIDYMGAGIFPLKFQRFYNSHGNETSESPQWRHNYSQSLKAYFSTTPPDPQEVPQVIALTRPNGELEVFLETGGNYVANDSSASLITRLPQGHPFDPGFQVVTAANQTEFYDLDGKLLKITAATGHSHTLNYDTQNPELLLSVADDFGKSLNFTYDNADLLADMTDPDGHVYFYVNNANGRLQSVTYPDTTPADPNDNPGIVYLYTDPNFPNALTGVQDENGDVYLSYSYDISGRAIQSQFSGGVGVNSVAYDDVNNTRTLTNALGLETVIQFDGDGFLVSFDRQASASGLCSAAFKDISYDVHGFKASTTDWNGNTVSFQHDSRGLQLNRTEAVGTSVERAFTTTWHPTLRLPEQIVEPGRTIDFSYDSNGNLLTRTDTDTTSQTVPYSTNGRTRTWTYTYYPQGSSSQYLLQTVDGPRTDVSDVTSFTYTTEGFVATITNPLNHVTQVTSYNSRGLPLTLIDSNGVTTQMTYHPRGWLLSSAVIDPGGGSNAVTSYEYDDVGQMTRVTLPNGSFLDYEYDAAHRLTAIENNLGERQEFTLDAAGNVTVQQIKAGSGSIVRTQSWVYDELSRIHQIIGGANQVTQMAYDSNGNQTGIALDPLGINQSTLQAFDELNRLTLVTDALSNDIAFSYDARNNLVSVTDQRGLATVYTYDGLNNLIQLDSPDTGITVFTYDDAGNQISKTDARNVVANYSYDQLNRLTAVTYPASSTENISYVYDQPSAGFGIGRFTQLTDQTGSTSYTYDHRGNQLSSAVTIQGNSYTTAYAYDLADNLIQTTYPSGRIVDHQLDALGRTQGVTSVAQLGGAVQTLADNIAYLPFGPMNSLDYGNGLDLVISNDLDYRVTGISVQDSAAQNPDVLGLTYTQNAVDNITAIADGVDTTESQTFVYDLLNRLENATGDYGSQAFTYDGVGNRLSLTRLVGGNTSTEIYNYDANSNRLLSVDKDGVVRTLQYDSAGNVVSDDRGAEQGFTLEYNDQNRLLNVTPAGGQ